MDNKTGMEKDQNSKISDTCKKKIISTKKIVLIMNISLIHTSG